MDRSTFNQIGKVVIDSSFQNKYHRFMVRPLKFEPDVALDKAMEVFWRKGFSATSTEDLSQAMGIGRQSLYNTFGDKRTLYLQALKSYQEKTHAGHLKRLTSPTSPLKGIRDLLTGLFTADDELRTMGCMGVASVAEFGTTDQDLMVLWSKSAPALSKRLVERIKEGQMCNEFDPQIRPEDAAAFIQAMMAGLQIAARGGADLAGLRRQASFCVDRLRMKS